jgi:hypothetical protein
MWENKISLGIGFVVFVIFFILTFAEFYLINNLTTYTILISFCIGLFTGCLVVAALTEQ